MNPSKDMHIMGTAFEKMLRRQVEKQPDIQVTKVQLQGSLAKSPELQN